MTVAGRRTWPPSKLFRPRSRDPPARCADWTVHPTGGRAVCSAPMSWEIWIVFLTLGGAILLFVTEWVRVDVVAVLVLITLALTGIVSYHDALSGFSNEAVVTMAAVLVLSGGCFFFRRKVETRRGVEACRHALFGQGLINGGLRLRCKWLGFE